MLVTPSGMVTSPFTPMMSVVPSLEQSIPFLELYTGLAASTKIDASPLQPENAFAPMFVTPAGIVTDVRLLHPQNVSFPMLIKLDGKVNDVNPLHPTKAPLPMLFTPEGIVNAVNLAHPANAFAPMFVTVDGIVTDVSPLRPENASSPMLVTPSGMVTSPFTPMMSVNPSLVQSIPFREQYEGLFESTENDLSPPRPREPRSRGGLPQSNALLAMFVTLDEIVTVSSP